MFCFTDGDGTQAKYVFYCNTSCLICSVMFLGVEFIQMEENGKWDYLTDTSNQVDLTTFCAFLYYYVRRWYDWQDPLVSVDSD